MREIRIICNPYTSEIMIEDPPHSKKYLGYVRTAAQLYDFFNKNPEGVQLRDRKKLQVIVDISELKNSIVRSELEEKIESIKWNRANILYQVDKKTYISKK